MNIRKTRAYESYKGMKRRCTKETDSHYLYYGGRGIRICERWVESFENFFEDMGERPPHYSLDREDNDGNYTPDNCRWASPKEQANNRRPRDPERAAAYRAHRRKIQAEAPARRAIREAQKRRKEEVRLEEKNQRKVERIKKRQIIEEQRLKIRLAELATKKAARQSKAADKKEHKRLIAIQNSTTHSKIKIEAIDSTKLNLVQRIDPQEMIDYLESLD